MKCPLIFRPQRLLIPGKLLATFIVIGSLLSCVPQPPATTSWQVYFSPHGNCTQFIVATLGRAQKRILVQAYCFTSARIAEALVQAHQRGVTVQVLVDKRHHTFKKTQIPKLTAAGIFVAVDKVYGIAHSKVMLIDQLYVLTGSFNWTDAAEHRNVENLVIVEDPKLHRVYEKEWQRRAEKAIPVS